MLTEDEDHRVWIREAALQLVAMNWKPIGDAENLRHSAAIAVDMAQNIWEMTDWKIENMAITKPFGSEPRIGVGDGQD